MSSYQPYDLHSQLTSDSDKFLSDGTAEFLTKELNNFPFLNNSFDWDDCSQPLFQNSGGTSTSEMCPVDPLTMSQNLLQQQVQPCANEMDNQYSPALSEDLFVLEQSQQEYYSQTSFIDSQDENQVPAIVPWLGNYNFSFTLEKGPTRKLSVIYSVKRNKLYCVPFVDIEFLFSYDFEKCVHKDMSLRAFLRYTNAENAAVPVARCMNHVHQDSATSTNKPRKPDFYKNEELVHHVLKCTTVNSRNEVLATHFRDSSGRCYVTVPMGKPQPGSSRISKMFRFDCLNSCRGDKSLKKASTTVVFELLRDKKVVGRISFELRVCSCPNRDFSKDEPTADTGISMPKGEKVTKNPSTVKNEAKAGCSTAAQETKKGALTAHDDSAAVGKKRRIGDQQCDAVQLPESQDTLVTSSQESVDEEDSQNPVKRRFQDYYKMAKYVLSLATSDDIALRYVAQAFARHTRDTYKFIRILEGRKGNSSDGQQKAGDKSCSTDSIKVPEKKPT